MEIITGNETIENKKEKVDEETIAKLSLHNHSLIPEAIKIMRKSSKYGVNEDFYNAITKTKMVYLTLMDKIKNINTPTKIIVGLYDRNTGIEMSRDIAIRIPNSTMAILYNSAHYPESEELENYLKEIVDFIAI